MFSVTVRNNGNTKVYTANNGKNLFELLREKGFCIDSPCNGNGTCGKCRVKLIQGSNSPAKAEEIKLLGLKALEDGYRLACRYHILSDIEILIDSNDLPASIATESIQLNTEFNPLVTKVYSVLEKPSLDNSVSDFIRVMNGSYNDNPLEINDLGLLRNIPDVIRKNNFEITLVKNSWDIIAVESGNTTNTLYGVAVDIGTTTIAAYLVDLTTGKKVSVTSLLNPQKAFGADVISRISYTMENEHGLEQLNSLLVQSLNVCITILCKQAGILPTDVYVITFAGNTTMLHLLLKVNPSNIAYAPFVPAFTSTVKVKASELPLNINPNGTAYILPGVSAYVGADTVGAVLAVGMHQQTSASLLIDIGTNGEIVLGDKSGMYACSAAAGPAFEGANIKNGMGSVNGAINSVSLKHGITYTTIGHTKPMGLCGTGVVGLIAELLEVGIVDETGRIDMSWEPESPDQESLCGRIVSVDGVNAFVLCKAHETLSGSEILLTQRDIREIQNAKAAIAAGIRVLVKNAGIVFEDIKQVYLAGGFGSYINIDSALKIGLIPRELEGRIVSVGNAAAQGAIDVLNNKSLLSSAQEISKSINYTELSNSKDFNDYYVDCMTFEEI
ncbi:ASKHA domain-containing protein [Clostridium sp. BNL1100]|uniref:ASKHA domain-containing protein n=1 Tax=Clostridium sp. BNL1100 TaxID=755731 RepID=UPI00024A7C13|nr:ASKHA domain-containing protein [Clostridium sp. BNL1100]AEY67968.1 putative metal-binding protein [Clostridium sp. BNL1100]